MDLTVTVASYNTRQKTLECLDSIEQWSEGVTCEVIVVDNASADGSGQAIEERCPWVYLVRNAENVGFARAHNAAIRQARGRYILVLNSDTVILDNALQKMVAFFDQAPSDVGAIGCRILFADLSLAPSARRFDTYFTAFATTFQLRRMVPPDAWLRKYFWWLLRHVHDNYERHDRVREVDFVDGACIMVRREALMDVGLLDEQYFLDFEDLDLCFRLKRAGWRALYFPGASIIHHMHQSRQQNPAQNLVHSFRSRLIFHSKMRKTLLPIRLIVVMGMAFRVIGGVLRWMSMPRRRQATRENIKLYLQIMRLAIRFRAEDAKPSIPAFA